MKSLRKHLAVLPIVAPFVNIQTNGAFRFNIAAVNLIGSNRYASISVSKGGNYYIRFSRSPLQGSVELSKQNWSKDYKKHMSYGFNWLLMSRPLLAPNGRPGRFSLEATGRPDEYQLVLED